MSKVDILTTRLGKDVAQDLDQVFGAMMEIAMQQSYCWNWSYCIIWFHIIKECNGSNLFGIYQRHIRPLMDLQSINHYYIK